MKGRAATTLSKVLNDTAERDVQLMEDINGCLTKNEDLKQCLLQAYFAQL